MDRLDYFDSSLNHVFLTAPIQHQRFFGFILVIGHSRNNAETKLT